jgi:hypothetical protein
MKIVGGQGLVPVPRATHPQIIYSQPVRGQAPHQIASRRCLHVAPLSSRLWCSTTHLLDFDPNFSDQIYATDTIRHSIDTIGLTIVNRSDVLF